MRGQSVVSRPGSDYRQHSGKRATAVCRVVAAGGTYFDRALRESGTLAPALPSECELQLIGELAVGHTNVEIGHLLGISSRTVESHLRRLFARYAVSSRAQLLMLAVREGWINPF